jgi:hypothetical protein
MVGRRPATWLCKGTDKACHVRRPLLPCRDATSATRRPSRLPSPASPTRPARSRFASCFALVSVFCLLPSLEQFFSVLGPPFSIASAMSQVLHLLKHSTGQEGSESAPRQGTEKDCVSVTSLNCCHPQFTHSLAHEPGLGRFHSWMGYLGTRHYSARTRTRTALRPAICFTICFHDMFVY